LGLRGRNRAQSKAFNLIGKLAPAVHKLQIGSLNVLVFGDLGCRAAFAGVSPKQISTRLHDTAFRRVRSAATPEVGMKFLNVLSG
jgi:hypothetical protein